MYSLLTTALIFAVLTAVWLSMTMASAGAVVGKIQGKPMRTRQLPAVAAYALMAAAIWYFAVQPAKNWYDAASRGAVLGLIVNGVYDLTNYSVFNDYSTEFAVTDTVVGTAIFAATAAAAKAICR